MILGIDGGIAAGAQVLLARDGRAVAGASWHSRQSGGRRVFVTRCASSVSGVVGRAEVDSPWLIGAACYRLLAPFTVGQSVVVAVEDVFVGRNPRTAVDLAKVAMGLAAPWSVRHNEPVWIAQGTWRRASFPRGWTKLYPAETRSASAKACGLAVMPALVPRLDRLLSALGRTDHLCDAAGVARCALIQDGVREAP